MKFSSNQEFEVHVHKCFDKIFELLMKVDSEVKKEADKQEAEGNYGLMSDMRDWVEEIILHCHLAWQYHRLSKGPSNMSTWDRIEDVPKKDGVSD